LRFIYAASATGKFKFTESILENSEKVVTPFHAGQELTRPRDFRYLRTVRFTAARLLEPSIQTVKPSS